MRNKPSQIFKRRWESELNNKGAWIIDMLCFMVASIPEGNFISTMRILMISNYNINDRFLWLICLIWKKCPQCSHPTCHMRDSSCSESNFCGYCHFWMCCIKTVNKSKTFCLGILLLKKTQYYCRKGRIPRFCLTVSWKKADCFKWWCIIISCINRRINRVVTTVNEYLNSKLQWLNCSYINLLPFHFVFFLSFDFPWGYGVLLKCSYQQQQL